MQPDDIPDDVWEEARIWLRRIDNLDVDEREGISRAILAERERCASVAEYLTGSPANAIAGAIRKGRHL